MDISSPTTVRETVSFAMNKFLVVLCLVSTAASQYQSRGYLPPTNGGSDASDGSTALQTYSNGNAANGYGASGGRGYGGNVNGGYQSTSSRFAGILNGDSDDSLKTGYAKGNGYSGNGNAYAGNQSGQLSNGGYPSNGIGKATDGGYASEGYQRANGNGRYASTASVNGPSEEGQSIGSGYGGYANGRQSFDNGNGQYASGPRYSSGNGAARNGGYTNGNSGPTGSRGYSNGNGRLSNGARTNGGYTNGNGVRTIGTPSIGNGGYSGSNGGYSGSNGGYSGSNGGYSGSNGGYSGSNGNGYQAGSQYSQNGQDDSLSEPAKYEFKYDVYAPEYNVEFGHEEQRDGDNTVGAYYVLLPDGRRQLVEYTADQEGFKPRISYTEEGTSGADGRSNGQSGYQAGQNGYQDGQNVYQGGQNGYQSQDASRGAYQSGTGPSGYSNGGSGPY